MNSKSYGPQHFTNLLWNLEETGRTEEAIRIASKLAVIHPNELYFKFRQHLALPVIYETKEEIDGYRNRFTRGLDEILRETSLSTPEAMNNAVESLQQNFYLAYQGYNDTELQKKYGEFVHRIMGAKYPQWVQPLPMPPLTKDGKIRIGYVSSLLRTHAATKCALGWIKYANKQKFEIYCYHLGSKTDSFTELFRGSSNRFYHFPKNLEAACQQIIADNLHILVFIDIGLSSRITRMAGLRVAPVQCTCMGHPVTSGSPTIDYFLSSELMEPEKGELHYSEKLIYLPNIGIS